ncbi:MAG: carbon storage regulator [Epulopiscium sp.]|jgi:carbon storage regulator|uniref:Translational regulator CsrA n=1 Tax=Defluviitalea raffinosedens TaxID=1450156 RepID=A0A7C8HFB8_9FIRM|nr:carbon storage regulator CsrA [Defluviitalea raffinosedens]KAE9635602.1 carbon storage regulator CsrA [Defluviitalea raffinosedens]MBM7684519.1 carbon storage regulator [Defluviitalea raffinosedens]MDK2786848.1 carbon storage regulator [Candidatus Epulonipiscium sp.]HHW68377.1 carbon storage regulator CsrA [Candidatus Epulonipiscium sp.]
MLALTRKKDESIIIGDQIEITVLDIQGDKVRLGIQAPKNIAIYRKEIFLEIKEVNEAAVQSSINQIRHLGKIFKK